LVFFKNNYIVLNKKTMSTAYPRSLSSFVNRISNYSRNTFKLTPYRTDSVTASQIIVCDLPSNALCDMETLCLRAKITTAATGFAHLPKHIESLIDKIVVEVNGATLGSASSLNHVYNLLLQYQNGSDLKIKRTPYQNGAGQTAAPATANITDQPIAIHSFLGFVSSVKPSVLDTALLGNVRIHIYLAPATVLPISNGATGVSYTLNSIYFMIDTIDISDGVYYNLHNQFLLSGGVYELPFTSIYTAMFSVGSYTQSSRFSINTQSLDMLAACFLPNHGTQSEINAATATSAYFNKTATNLDTWQMEVGGVSIPQFAASGSDTLPLALNALCLSQDTLGGFDSLITTDAVYKANFFAPIVRLNHPTEESERFISGINTLGSSTNVLFKSTATSGAAALTNCQLLICAFCTSSLRVSAGRSIQVVS
jgi:hypothetical protein